MLRRLIDLRTAKITEARAILDAAANAVRDLNDDERARVDALQKEIDTLSTDISRAQALEAREAEVLRSLGTLAGRPSPAQAPVPEIGLSEGEVQRYSLVRALRAAVMNDWREAGFEREASQAVAQRIGRSPQGFFVPNDVARRWSSANVASAEQRDLNRGTNSAGGYTVATDLLANEFVDLLRTRMVAQAAGARVLADLVGDVTIPKLAGSATGTWVSETGTVTAADASFGQIALAPKTVKARTAMTRRLLMQSSIDVEAMVRDDIAKIIARAIDFAALHGTGSSNQPRGVANTSGIGAVVGGTNGIAPAWSHIVDLESKVAVANADLGALAYITSAKVRGKLKQTPKVASTDSRMLWEGNEQPVNGYPVQVTNQVRDDLTKGSSSDVCSAIFFANWNDLIVGFWGVLDVLVDPYTARNNGNAIIVDAMQDCDVAVRHPESFAAMLDALAA